MNETNINWVVWGIMVLFIYGQHYVITSLRDDKDILEKLGEFIIKPDGRLEKKK